MPTLKNQLHETHFLPRSPGSVVLSFCKEQLASSPPDFAKQSERVEVKPLSNQMLTLTIHLWGEESAFAHVPLTILCMPQFLSYADQAVFSGWCDLHSA